MKQNRYLVIGSIFFTFTIASCESQLERDRKEGIAECQEKIPSDQAYDQQRQQCVIMANRLTECRSKFENNEINEGDLKLCVDKAILSSLSNTR